MERTDEESERQKISVYKMRLKESTSPLDKPQPNNLHCYTERDSQILRILYPQIYSSIILETSIWSYDKDDAF